MSNIVFSSFSEMYKAYKDEFPFERVVSGALYRSSGLKAHVVREVVDFNFRYVPLSGDQHVFMFKTLSNLMEFKKLLGDK